MLGNVLLLCFLVFFVFGIVGVQLYKGILRNRCFFDINSTDLAENFQHVPSKFISSGSYFKPDFADDYICSTPESGGLAKCSDIPEYLNEDNQICNQSIAIFKGSDHGNDSCVNWNSYFTKCQQSESNPFRGSISFDNIGLAWIAIFQVSRNLISI